MALLVALALTCSDDDGPSGDDGGDFDPGSNTELEGERSFESVTIPAGVTVTVTNDLTLNVAGPVVIAGTLIGDCEGLTINGAAEVTITGTVSNACATQPDGDPPGLTIVGDGEMEIDGATIRSSGDIEMKNDPELSFDDADLVGARRTEPGAGLRKASAPESGGTSTQAARPAPAGDPIGPPFRGIGSSIQIDPQAAPVGVSGGPGGGNGGFGQGIRLGTSGPMFIDGVTIRAQDGGGGRPDVHASAEPSEPDRAKRDRAGRAASTSSAGA